MQIASAKISTRGAGLFARNARFLASRLSASRMKSITANGRHFTMLVQSVSMSPSLCSNPPGLMAAVAIRAKASPSIAGASGFIDSAKERKFAVFATLVREQPSSNASDIHPPDNPCFLKCL